MNPQSPRRQLAALLGQYVERFGNGAVTADVLYDQLKEYTRILWAEVEADKDRWQRRPEPHRRRRHPHQPPHHEGHDKCRN